MRRVHSYSTPPRLLLGLIGSGLTASRTPEMHEREAACHGLHCLYQRIDLEIQTLTPSALPRLIDGAELMGFAGLNVTHPCKQAVLPLLTRVSDHAARLEAVNTVVFTDGQRIGHNTDWTAFRRAFEQGLPGASLREVVQLGAGGAGSATAYAALDMGAARVTVVDIDPRRAEALVARLGTVFPGRIHATDDLPAALRTANGLIHATPTGMASVPGLPLDRALLRPDLWIAEVVYFPVDTELLRAARSLGCRTLDGTDMAIYQAVEAFQLFTGLEADVARMRATFNALGHAS
jgi:shikimate dehydrogenase